MNISMLVIFKMAALEQTANEPASETTSSEEDEIEEVEPQLKYRRLANDVTVILRKQAASCIAVTSKFLVLGSHWGVISVLDHLGNNIKCAKLMSHTTTVNQISIDDSGDYLASCSDDGRVIIHGLYTSDNTNSIMFDRPIKAIAIDPDYYKPGSGRRFITGDNKLILHEKTFISRLKTTVLHDSDGIIRNIKWRGQFVAWSTDSAVRVYDTIGQKIISSIKKDHNPNLRAELYRCNMSWKDDHTLLIGWADSVKICHVKSKRPLHSSSKEEPYNYVEITSMFTTEFYVAGIAPYNNNNIVILSYSLQAHQESIPNGDDAKRPQLRIVEPQHEDFDDLSMDVLSIKGFAQYRCNDYHLDCLTEEGLFVIVSPRDVVMAEPRDADDHIAWLLEHAKYEEALAAVKQSQNVKDLKRHTLLQVGRTYLDHLLETGNYDDAARLCVEILGKDKSLWELEVYKFATIRQLKSISPYLPRGPDVRLSPAIYEMVFNEFLQTDYQGFQNLIKEWSSSLYDVQTVINAVIDRLLYDASNPILLQCLGDLYTHERQYDKSLAIYLKLGHKEVFDLIRKHTLYFAIQDKLEPLMQMDADKAIHLFLENLNQIPVDVVVKRLERRPDLLYQYLDRVFAKDATLGEEYHGLQVKLYAEYQPTKLLAFLRNSNYYPLQEALDVCQMFHLTVEMVFLLGRMGNTKQALQLIVEELVDVDRAIEFCKEHDDRELWEDLIAYSLDKPQFINTLLNNIGTHIDPIMIIKQIKKKLEIPGLRDSLVKILQDYTLQISLREGCKKILVSDCFNLLKKLNAQQRRGIAVHDDQVCPACQGRIFVGDLNQIGGVVVFYCRHTFHEDCVPNPLTSLCTVCHAQKRMPGSATLQRT